jgi:predicted unusual protein kinase regulating ubiquinone biosynthesis (AarF/ABC1/UbiB family)
VTDDRPATRGRRFLKLAGMTASVASNYARTTVKGIFQNAEAREAERSEAYRESGSMIARTLGELKGAVMKVGQMASIAQDILPKEIADALSTLQKQAPPMDYAVIAEQIEKELGAPPEQLFAHFEKTPFASASIGQVHRARTDDGREVVVKVQYPGVDSAVDSDLRHLKLALRVSGLINVPKAAMDASFDELRERLHEELDYCNEADNVRIFREYHKQHPFVAIPEVVGSRSAQRVLTLVYEPGEGITNLDAAGFDQATRDKLGLHLFLVTMHQIFEFGCIHADPNPGNYAFRQDGTLVLYDFGCVKRLQAPFVEAYRDTILSGRMEDWSGVDDGLLRLGVRRPDAPPVEGSFYKPWRDMFTLPFEEQPRFDFGAAKLHEDVVKQVPSALKRLSSFQPAKELIFVDRAIVGMYGNLRTLRARVPVLERTLPMLHAFDPAHLTATQTEIRQRSLADA